MSELSFEQMLEDSLKTIRTGEIVEGTVIDVKEDEIILNIGYKSDGIVSRNEYTNVSNADLTTMVSVGDTMEVKVLKVNDGEGQVQLSYRRVAQERGSKRLEEAFENREVLTAKVQALLRRSYAFAGDPNTLSCGAVTLDLKAAALRYGGGQLELSRNELRILELLFERQGEAVSREELMGRLWETENFIDDNTLTVTMKRLRKKLHQPIYLKTVRSIGYCMEEIK